MIDKSKVAAEIRQCYEELLQEQSEARSELKDYMITMDELAQQNDISPRTARRWAVNLAKQHPDVWVTDLIVHAGNQIRVIWKKEDE